MSSMHRCSFTFRFAATVFAVTGAAVAPVATATTVTQEFLPPVVSVASANVDKCETCGDSEDSVAMEHGLGEIVLLQTDHRLAPSALASKGVPVIKDGLPTSSPVHATMKKSLLEEMLGMGPPPHANVSMGTPLAVDLKSNETNTSSHPAVAPGTQILPQRPPLLEPSALAQTMRRAGMNSFALCFIMLVIVVVVISGILWACRPGNLEYMFGDIVKPEKNEKCDPFMPYDGHPPVGIKSPSPSSAAAVLLQKSPAKLSHPSPKRFTAQQSNFTAQDRSFTAQPSRRSSTADRPDEAQMPSTPIRGGPPVLCRTLVLPNTEARFTVSMESLLTPNPTSSIDIAGMSGKKLLQASINREPNHHAIQLCTVGCEDNPQVSAYFNGDVLNILGRNAEFFGSLEPATDSQNWILTRNGLAVMQVVPVEDTGEIKDLRLIANTMLGQVLATAGRISEASNSWMLRVQPGADTILIASCMLALIILRPMASRGPGMNLTPKPSGRAPGTYHNQ